MNIWPGFSIRTSLNKERAGRREAILLVSGVLLLVLAAASICMGAVPVTLRELAEALTTGETATSAGRIIWFVRMPRTLAAILAGSALAVSGAVLQTVLNNPLASPSIIGVNAGSGLFTIALAAFSRARCGIRPQRPSWERCLPCLPSMASPGKPALPG